MENGVQLHRRVQDENAGLGTALNNKQQQPAPLSARKAFGNITNTNKGLGQGDNPAGGGGAPPKPRRALGELSVNRRAAAPQQEQQKQQHALGGWDAAARPPAAAPLAAAPRPEGVSDLAWRYAQDGVERWAGKTWGELEEEREAREEADAAEAARRLQSRMPSWRSSVRSVGRGGPRARAVCGRSRRHGPMRGRDARTPGGGARAFACAATGQATLVAEQCRCTA
jgi:hypothetical protein